MMEYIKNIRNFAIIAHIDHGKSTLSDRLIEMCQGLTSREMFSQVLDSMDIERERGITIKAQAVRLLYKSKDDGEEYTLNFIDTPGHVDFGYEVSRSLRACEGSILVIDATQGVEAQTLANVYKAIDCNHEFIIAVNKMDLPTANIEKVKEEVENVIGMDTTNIVPVSAKTGYGMDNLLQKIVDVLPPPVMISHSELRALLVDSWYDQYLGVVILIRVMDGIISRGMEIKMISNNAKYVVDTVGVFTPKKVQVSQLQAGEVGFISCAIKNIRDCNVGDTIVSVRNYGVIEPIPGFKKTQPVVFCSLYTIESSDFPMLQDAIEKLHLNDQSFEYEIENSSAFGFGLRCGFLGLLHIEVIQERLEREFGLSIITTSPSVTYRINLKSQKVLEIHNPNDMPDPMQVAYIEEPYVRATIIVPEKYVGPVLSLCNEKRGQQMNMTYSNGRVILTYRLPLNEIVYDFYDTLKSCSSGYASFDWEFEDYSQGDLVKLNIFVNGEIVDGFSSIIHRSKAESRGRSLCLKLKDLIPRHMFQVAIQAAIGNKVIAREDVKAMRKNVTAKCYGGDITRKRKLLEKQKEGKKKMKAVGKVSIPQSAFIATLKIS